MKKIKFMLPLLILAFVACQKEQEVKQYSGYYVRSPKDSSKWITIEEYNRLYPSHEKAATKGWEECFFQLEGETKWTKGRTCMNERKTGCTDPAGCRGLPVDQ